EQHQGDDGAEVLAALAVTRRFRRDARVHRRLQRRNRRARGADGGRPFGPRLGGDAHQLVLMLPAISKIGMYIATTRPPITPPRNTIIRGSMRLVMAATATSTSSS